MSERALVKYDAAKPVKVGGGVAGFRQMLEQRKGMINSVAASFMSPERVTKILLNNLSKSPKLMDCTMESIFRSALGAVELGLEPGGALGQAHLVPYGAECQLLVDYKGLVELSYRSGQIKAINAFPVYEGDTYNVNLGLHPTIEHSPNLDANRDPGNVRFVYAVVELKDGGIIYDYMTRNEIEAIRARSRAKNAGPWVTDWTEMAKKTVLRRLLKRCPKSIELQKALALENRTDSGDTGDVFDFEVIEGEAVEVPSRTEQAKQKLDRGVDWDKTAGVEPTDLSVFKEQP